MFEGGQRVSIERPEIDGAELEGYGASTATNEGRSGGSDQMAADSGANLREWDVTVTMVRTVDGRKETRDFTVRVPAADRKGALVAGCGIGDAINEGSRYAWKIASDEAVRVQRVDGSGATVATAETAISDDMVREFERGYNEACNYPDGMGPESQATRAGLAAVVPLIRAQVADERLARLRSAVVPADGLVKVGRWPTIADAGTVEFDRLWAELEDGPEPVVELDQEIDCCARAAGRHTRGGPDHCGLCGKPFDVPLPPVGDEPREYPGDRPTEGAAGEVSRD